MPRRERRRQGHTEFRRDENDTDSDSSYVPRGFPIPSESTANTIWDPNLDPDLARRRSVPKLARRRSLPLKGKGESNESPKRDVEDESSCESPREREEMSSMGPKLRADGKGLAAILASIDSEDERDEEEKESESEGPKKTKKGDEVLDKVESKHKDDNDDENGSASLMVRMNDSESSQPLHDLECVGIDTCSAKSISCDKEDFLDLLLASGGDVEYELRGIGGVSKAAGKGVIVIYAKDLEGRLKAVVEPKGVYLENPVAKFRILGQQKMKVNGLALIQDYDDRGMDVLKCKRSGCLLPLEEGGGILLLRTFRYKPNDKMERQLKEYAKNLVKANDFLPHVLDLDELSKGDDTVLLLNEAKLKTENYERLLHWRFGHASSKVLKQWI